MRRGEAASVYRRVRDPLYVARCVKRLAGSGVLVASVVGFPLGASRTEVTVEETRAVEDGAAEIDMVVALGELIAGNLSFVRDDIAAIAEATHGASKKNALKVSSNSALYARADHRRLPLQRRSQGRFRENLDRLSSQRRRDGRIRQAAQAECPRPEGQSRGGHPRPGHRKGHAGGGAIPRLLARVKILSEFPVIHGCSLDRASRWG